MKRILAMTCLAGVLASGRAPAQDVVSGLLVDDTPTLITNLPYTITEPGIYYLNSDLRLSEPGKNGIRVQADRVGIEGYGFSIVGAGDGSGNGVMQDVTCHTLIMESITFKGWGGKGKYAICAPGQNDHFEKISVVGSSRGILAGPNARVFSCAVCSNSPAKSVYGIEGMNGAWVKGCVVHHLEGVLCAYGIRVDADGKVSATGVGNITAQGPAVGVLVGPRALVSGSEILDCVGEPMKSAGVKGMQDSAIRDSAVRRTRGNGIWATDGVAVDNNVCEENSGAGVYVDGHGCRIMGNTVSRNGCGIRVLSTGNRIEGNHSDANARAYDIADPAANDCDAASRAGSGKPTATPAGKPDGKAGPAIEIQF